MHVTRDPRQVSSGPINHNAVNAGKFSDNSHLGRKTHDNDAADIRFQDLHYTVSLGFRNGTKTYNIYF